MVCHFLRFVSHFLLFLQESTSFASFLCLRSSFLWLWLSLMAWALHFQQRRAPAHLYHGLSAVVHCACIKTKSCSSILLHLNRMYLFFVRTRSLNHAARLCGSLDVETTPVFVHNSPRGCIIRNLWCVRCFSLSVCLLHSYSCEFVFYFLSISLTYLAV